MISFRYFFPKEDGNTEEQDEEQSEQPEENCGHHQASEEHPSAGEQLLAV